MGIHKNVGRWGDGEMGRWEDGKDFDSVSHSYEVDSRFPIQM
ncbi:hypothetical protein [Moorena sp. SIO4G3]|nr:hypothetical protein [Moorena sp. SIO4G3]